MAPVTFVQLLETPTRHAVLEKTVEMTIRPDLGMRLHTFGQQPHQPITQMVYSVEHGSYWVYLGQQEAKDEDAADATVAEAVKAGWTASEWGALDAAPKGSKPYRVTVE